MQKLKAIVRGGQTPKGTVKISGAKNSATKLLAASLISDEEITLCNFPTELVDVQYKISFIKELKGIINVDDEKETVTINSSQLTNKELSNYEYFFRTTYLLVPGLLKRSGEAMIPYPGGCKIGQRGYDLHISTWEKFGAQVEEKENYIHVSAKDGFRATIVDFPISTIGGTETALICASIADGTSVIKNAYISPEVEDLISFLKMMGVQIQVAGKSYIEVIGRKTLKGGVYSVMPDRIEALTWIIFGILSKGTLLIKDVPFSAMEIPIIHLRDAGIDIYQNGNSVYIDNSVRKTINIQPFELATGTHPGVISDMQPFFVLLALHADGRSKVFDYRYPERIKYCAELLKFYPQMLSFEKGKIEISGGNNFSPKAAKVTSTDLRGSMALFIAALLADEESEISEIDMAMRGYNKLQEKLEKLGIIFQIKPDGE